MKQIRIIGRRGAIQSAFTTKELRELVKTNKDTRISVIKEEIERSMNPASITEVTISGHHGFPEQLVNGRI